MRLSKRIHTLADKVKAGETAADIGTDHGYVPMLLLRNNISPRVIMSDISEGSLAKARETFAMTGLPVDDRDFRVGDGLDTLLPGEVDDIIIGGLGGFTIINILEKDENKSRSFSKLIMQPRKHSGALRHYLYTHGWDIVDEDLAPEGKFVCEIITAVYSGICPRTAPYPEDDIRWKYPAEAALTHPELSAKRISWKIGSIEEEIRNLAASRSDKTGEITALEKDRLYLQKLVK